MSSDLLNVLDVRRGHFRFESGHHGDMWLDLDALFLYPAAVRPHAEALADRLGRYRPDGVCGPLTGGAFLAQTIAEILDVAFLPTQPTVAGGSSKPVGYRLPAALRERIAGWRLVLVDDAINAGSAVRASYAELAGAGARPVALGALLDLGRGEQLAATLGLALQALVVLPGQLWQPPDCPLCRAAAPMDFAG